MLVWNASPRGLMCVWCPMFSFPAPCELFFTMFYCLLVSVNVVSVMLYPFISCVTLLMDLFVLCVACLMVFVNYLVKQFAICLGVVAILLLNVMEVLSVGGGVLLGRPCMLFQRMFVCCACNPSVHLNVHSIGFVYACVCRKCYPHLGV